MQLQQQNNSPNNYDQGEFAFPNQNNKHWLYKQAYQYLFDARIAFYSFMAFQRTT